MKYSLWIAALAGSMVLVSCTQAGSNAATPSSPTVSASPASENVEQIITRLENEWVTAIVAKDTATIDRVLADDFRGTTNEQTYSKADAIDDVKSGIHESLNMDNVQVRVFGDTAVATLKQTEKSRHGTEDFSGHYLFTNVWLNRNGQWRAIASHGSRVR